VQSVRQLVNLPNVYRLAPCDCLSVQVTYFLCLDILQREDNASVEPGASIVSTAVYDEFQRNLEHFHEGSKRSIQEVSNWIKVRNNLEKIM